MRDSRDGAAGSAVVADPPTTMFGRQVEYRFVVATVFVCALFLDILDTTIVNVAIPTIGRELKSDAVEWVALGYTLSLAVWIPASGWLGDRFGTKRVFMTALVVFITFSAACGAAQNFHQLVTFRVLQGVGGGMLTPVGVAMMFRAFPPAERARAATIVMIPTLTAPALGPVLGGFLTKRYGWEWIFYVNLPVGLIAVVFGFKFLREHTEPSAGRFDVTGFLLSGAGLAAVCYALSEGPRHGWSHVSVWGVGLVGVASFALLVYVETHIDDPMLALRLLGERLFKATNVVMAFGMAGFFGLIFVLPLYLQNLRGLDALESGLITFPQAFGILISSQIAGRLYPRVGPRRLMAFGMFGSAAVMSLFLTFTPDTNFWWIRVLMFARGLTMGFPFVSSQAASYARITPSDNGRASAIFQTQRQTAISVGIALTASVLGIFSPLAGRPPDIGRAMTGYHWTFVVAATTSAISAICALLLVKDADAAGTMRRVSSAGARDFPPGTLERREPAPPHSGTSWVRARVVGRDGGVEGMVRDE